MYYIIDGEEDVRYETAKEVCEYIFDPDNYDDDDALDEWINDCYYDQRCNIAGETYYPADIVKELDNYTYRELRSEWAQNQSENDIEYYTDEVEDIQPGEKKWIGNYHVECFEDKEPDEDDLNEAFNSLVGVQVL